MIAKIKFRRLHGDSVSKLFGRHRWEAWFRSMMNSHGVLAMHNTRHLDWSKLMTSGSWLKS
jgi:hypothetical protein